ncbi:PHD finger-containing protein DDB_G0268158-like [Topomyia yanbarensis]|uniref:PHD finger-containing protein DDB_G0268158-like n=1 Tax=Topomyia yanbarensis TaxID=2498891 RepID=UPI00273B5E10|nr:PHD finger-containing protein DDB_G0268158-like [Topomyia yanbarensis]
MGAASTGADSLECCNNQEEGTARNNQNQNHPQNRAQHQSVAQPPVASARNPTLPLVMISNLTPTAIHPQSPPVTMLQSPTQPPPMLTALHLNSVQQQAQRNDLNNHYSLDIENNNQSNHLYVNPQANFNYDYYLQTFFDEHEYYNRLNNNNNNTNDHKYGGTIYSEAATPMTVEVSNLSTSCHCLFLRYCKHRKRSSSASFFHRTQLKPDQQKAKKATTPFGKESEPKKPKPAGPPRNRGAANRGIDNNDADPLMRRPRRRKDNSEQDLAAKQQQQQQQGAATFDQKQQQAKSVCAVR